MKKKNLYFSEVNDGEALTLRIELPEGYFVGAGLTINFMDYVRKIL